MKLAPLLAPLVLLSSIWIAPPQPSEPRVAAAGDVYQLLVNPGLNDYAAPYDYFQGIPCQVATGWHRFWVGTDQPWWMDTRVFAASDLGSDWVECIEEPTSQLILSTEPYDAGVWQQVGGLVPGTGYGFHAAMLTIFQTSAQEPVDGTMFKQVGIDPTGGTDPLSPNIVWSQPDGHDQGPWDVDSVTAAYAQASTVTVFARINSLYPSGGLPYLNLSFVDSAILAQTATVSAVAPAQSATASFLVRWDNAVPSPDATIRWYDVQWLDEVEGTWHDWFIWTEKTSATFTGAAGHAYRFRARAWQRYPNGAHLFSPYRAEGDTRTCVDCPATLWGRVLTHDGRPLSGATVALPNSAYAVTSGVGGAYSLSLPTTVLPASVSVVRPGWTAPPPLLDVRLAPEESLAMTWTLTLPGDAIVNGDFEAGLDGWSPGPEVTLVGEPVHTGGGALRLTSSASAASLSQTTTVSGAWEPALAFWYRPEVASAGDELQVMVSMAASDLAAHEPLASTLPAISTQIVRPSLAAGGWQFFSWKPGPPDIQFTGTVTVELRLLDDGLDPTPLLYLDEVRLAPTPGGPLRTYLPLVDRQF